MNEYSHRAQNILEKINELASITETPGCITRTYGTRAFIEGRDKVADWMKQAGLKTTTDNIGNIRGRIESGKTGARTLVIASHIDTVINAGRFDGPLGVLMGLDLTEQIIQSKRALPFHIELIGFCDEEGCRFHTTYLGSKAVAGTLEKEMPDKRDETGISLGEVMEQNGGDVNNLSKDAIAKEDWLGYFEIHIEQGPVLYESNIPIGLVSSIAGQCRIELIFKGEAGHAGTVPMNMRKDALACAAKCISAIEKFARTNKKDLVATVGKLHITSPASNVIPGEVICSLDIRSAKEDILVSSCKAIREVTETICKKRSIDLQWNLIQQSAPVTCDKTINKLLARSIKESGFDLVKLVSGAGHDAVAVSAVSPVAMLFVRCFKGISHNPKEDVDVKDIAAAIKVSDNFIEQLISADMRE